MPTELLSIDLLTVHSGLQLRKQISQEHVDRLVEAYVAEGDDEGAKVPPIGVLFDSKTYWVWDGNHRVLARNRAGFDEIEAVVEKGTYRDAVLRAAGANHSHGLPRSNADKRFAVRALLEDKTWGKRSDRWLADACKVSRGLVSEVRTELAQAQVAKLPPAAASDRVVTDDDATARVGRDGKTYRGNGRQAAQDAPGSTRDDLHDVRDDQGDDDDDAGNGTFSAAQEQAGHVLFGRLQDLYRGHLQRQVKLQRQELQFVQAVLDGQTKLVPGSQAEDQALQLLGLHRPDLPEPAGVVYGEAEQIAGDKIRQRLVEWLQRQLANIDDLTWPVISRQLAALAEECRDWETTP